MEFKVVIQGNSLLPGVPAADQEIYDPLLCSALYFAGQYSTVCCGFPKRLTFAPHCSSGFTFGQTSMGVI